MSENSPSSQPTLTVKGIVRRMYGSGTSDPFQARMVFQICDIRNQTYPQRQEEFDEFFMPITQNLQEAKFVKEECIELIKKHSRDIEEGKHVRVDDQNHLHVDETIDFHLNVLFKDFFIRGCIALDCLKEMMDRFWGVNINFFFGGEKNYDKKLLSFKTKHPDLIDVADMLDGDRRTWIPTFIEMRNDIEHKGFRLPDIQYTVFTDRKSFKLIMPTFNGHSLQETLELMWNNLFTFFEDILVIMCSKNLSHNLAIAIIPEDKRDPTFPVKYKVTLDPESMKKLLEKIKSDEGEKR